MAKTVTNITIHGTISQPLITKFVHGRPRGNIKIFNPEYKENSPEPKHLNIFFSHWAGLQSLLTKGRTLVFTGEFKHWEWEALGKVFICREVRELTLDDVKPTHTNEVFEEYEF